MSATPTSANPSSLAVPTAGERPPLTAKLRALRDALLADLVERDVAIRLALIAALAGEHMLMLGPPGTAKSLVARRLHLAFSDATYFERLLTRFTVPEELFGPLSIKGLEDDRYERLTACYLPTASIAFLDEIFKANSAILNALLTLLNERMFDNGTQRLDVPLVAVIGASNELPEAEELDALFDRFLVRLHVGPVSKEGFKSLLGLRGHAAPTVPDALRLTGEDLIAVRDQAEKVEVPGDVEAMLCDLRLWCTAENIQVSDRRWRKIVKLLQVSALTNGRNQVSIWDCWLLQHCLWDIPEEREKVYEWYASRVGATAAWDTARITNLIVRWEWALKADEDHRSQMQGAQGEALFKGSDGAPQPNPQGTRQKMRGNEPLFLAPADGLDERGYAMNDRTNEGKGYTRAEFNRLHVNDRFNGRTRLDHWSGTAAYLANPNNWHVETIDLPPMMEPTRHKRVHVDARLSDVDQLRSDVHGHWAGLAAQRATLEADIRSHLWVTADFAGPASQNLERSHKEVGTLLMRVDKLRKGFEGLPIAADPLESVGQEKKDRAKAKPGAPR